MDTTTITENAIIQMIMFRMTISILMDWFANFIDSTFKMNAMDGRIEALMRPTEAPAKAVRDETLGNRMEMIPGSMATVMYITILMTN